MQARLEADTADGSMVYLHYGDDFERLLPLNFSDLSVESRLGNTPREIKFANGQMFITDHNDEIDELISRYSSNNKVSFLYKLESNLGLVAVSMLATIGLVALLVVYGIPKAAKVIAYQLPDSITEKMTDGLTLLDKVMFEPSTLDTTRQAEIRALAEPYFKAHSHLHPVLEFRTGVGPNAFALPGGEIVFTDEFVELAANDDELLAVLFHELGHLEHRHLLRRVLQDSMVALMVIYITGDIDTIDLMTGIPTFFLDLSYSRDFETEADTYALQQLHRFEMPIESFATIMLRLNNFYGSDDASEEIEVPTQDSVEDDQKKKSIVDFFSTHPGTQDRVLMVQEYKRQHGLN